MAEHYFARTDPHRFQPSRHTGGAWRRDEQHFSPLGGLLVHEIERRSAQPLILSRITFDILGSIPIEPFDVHVETIRPGRTIELVEATVTTAGRAMVRARAWLLTEQDSGPVRGGAPQPLPPPEDLPRWPMDSVWPGGYIASIDVRRLPGARPGRGAVWVATPHALVDGESASPLASFVALVDTANGVVVRERPSEWMFPNVDLSIHLYRQPAGGWTGLDTTVTFGPSGQGLTSSVLHDRHGPVGHASQILTVRPLPG